MKVKRSEKLFEPCESSLSFLHKKVSEYMQNNGIHNETWYPDLNIYGSGADDRTNIVLFGNFSLRFFESGNWNFKKAHFFVLSRSVKSVMTEVLKIPGNCISVISRYDLISAKPTVEYDISNKVSLVFSGRISRTKNIEGLLRVFKELEKLKKNKFEFHLIGEFDENYHLDYGRFEYSNTYEKFLNDKVSELAFNVEPIFHKKMDQDKWVESFVEQPVLISLSSYICEDFGVSIAQAQQVGWPVILSDWGAHKDVTEGKSCLIPYNLIPISNEPSEIQSLKAKGAAKYIVDNWVEPREKHEIIDFDREEISINELDSMRRELISDRVNDYTSYSQAQVDLFADSKTGIEYFIKYRDVFSLSTFDSIVICHDTDDYHSNNSMSSFDLFDINIEKTVFLSTKNAFFKSNLEKILDARTIFLAFEKDKNKVFVEKINTIVGPEKIKFLTS